MFWETLSPFVNWIGSTPFALWVGSSTARIAWLFIFHLFGLVLLLGGTVVLSLRLLGLTMVQTPARTLARSLFPVITVGLLVMMASGGTIFVGGAESYFAGSWFRLKMILLLAAVVFQFLVFRPVAYADEGRFGSLPRACVAIAALLLWFSVGWAGRAIAFF